jgi:hypothetical protein
MKFTACSPSPVSFADKFGAGAQTSTTQICGTVSDATGASVPNAAVALTNDSTGVVQRQTTTEAGLFAFPSIPAGAYTVRVEAKGFRTYQSRGNIVQINTPLALAVSLEVGAVGDTVEVTASSEAVQTSNAVVGNVVERKAIMELPLNGRNPLNLLMYEPGVVQRSGNTVNVNSARAMAVNVTIDGIEANESTNPNPTNTSSILIRTTSRSSGTTSNPSPEEGRNSGATVSIATLRRNQIHATASAFLPGAQRQRVLRQRPGRIEAAGQLNQYGFEVGGPIRKNKIISAAGEKVASQTRSTRRSARSIFIPAPR